MTSALPSKDAANGAAAVATDLALALRLADAADRIASSRFGALDLAVETKPDLTPVSDADRAVETELRTILIAERPTDAVSGEEFGTTGDSSRHWVIDPIDGTKSFIRGVPVWASLIALVDNGLPTVGVVSAPGLNRRWWGSRGAGAFVSFSGGEPRRLAVSGVRDLADASLSYSSLSGWPRLGLGEAFYALSQKVWRSRAYGDFWSYMMVAEGAVDITAEPELNLWDMAALWPIVTEAGGRFTGLNGVDGIEQGNAAASNGLLHNQLLASLTL
jgi:histidinol-phosphatase